MSNVILEVKDLKTKYVTRQKEAVYAVDGVSLQIEDGKILGVAGESGCGKSTLALSLMGYYFPPLHYISGDILVDGKNILRDGNQKLYRKTSWVQKLRISRRPP